MCKCMKYHLMINIGDKQRNSEIRLSVLYASIGPNVPVNWSKISNCFLKNFRNVADFQDFDSFFYTIRSVQRK